MFIEQCNEVTLFHLTISFIEPKHFPINENPSESPISNRIVNDHIV